LRAIWSYIVSRAFAYCPGCWDGRDGRLHLDLRRHAQVDLRHLAVRGVALEELPLREVEHAGDRVARELLDLGVIGHDAVVVELARERDLVLGRGELLLQCHHVLVGLEVGIVLGHGEQRAQRLGEGVLGLGLGRGALGAGGDGGGTRVGDLGQRVLLELHVAFDRRDQVGDQVVPSFELHVDLAPGVVDLVAAAHDAVVGRPQQEGHHHYDDDHHDECDHSVCSFGVLSLRSIVIVRQDDRFGWRRGGSAGAHALESLPARGGCYAGSHGA
jgi:hypothetical protein